MASNIPVIVQGNSFNLAIPLQIYVINGDQMELQDYTPDPTDQISIQLKGSRRNYTYTPTSVTDNVCMIALGGYELADNYSVAVSIGKANGQRLRSFRTDQFFIVESSDDLTQDDIIQGLEENVIYLNSSIFVAGADGRGIVSITKVSTQGLVDTYAITYTDGTSTTFQVTNGAQGAPGATISSVEKTATAGKVDTYTITMTDGNTFDFEVTNGLDGVDLGLANIVNDLTTGGATNVLSAEMGKTLNERLDPVEDALEISSSSEVVSERIPYGYNSGYLATNNRLVPQSSSLFRYTDPIFLKQGDSLTMKAVTDTGYGRLASCDSQGQNVTTLLTGQSQSNTDVYENTYTALDDIYVIVCWKYNNSYLELTKSYMKDITTSKIDDVNELVADIDNIDEILDVDNETSQSYEDVPYTKDSGHYYTGSVNGLAVYSTNVSFSCTNALDFNKGEHIQIIINGNVSTPATLVVLDDDKYRCLVKGGDLIEFDVPLDGTYIVSFPTIKEPFIKKRITNVTSRSTRLDAIDDAIAILPTLQADVDSIESAVETDVNANLTDDLLTGYISHNGAVPSYSGCSHKEFEVRAGSVINFTAYVNGNLAAIAKKTRDGYVELVSAAAQESTQTFTYTAQESMTIAVSFYNNHERSLEIYTQNISSNRLEIENIFDSLQTLKRPDYGLIFDKIAVIGDSLSIGTLDAISGVDGHGAGQSYGCSWLTCLAHRWGSSTRMHYSKGGANCYSWLGSNDSGLGLMLKDNIIYDIYIIALGHNDYGGFTIGTVNDTPTEVAVDGNYDVTVVTPRDDSTFLGNYKKIVNEVRTKAPNALIFCMTTYDKDSNGIGSMNQHIHDLADWYYAQGDHKVFFLNYAEKTDISRQSAGYAGSGVHFLTFGYVYISNIVNECINDIIEQYLTTTALELWGNYLESYRTTRNDQTRSGGYLPHL